MVPCMRALRDIPQGEELTMDYEYDPYNSPEWFSQAVKAFVQTASEEELENLNVKYDRFVRYECGMADHRKFVFNNLGEQEQEA